MSATTFPTFYETMSAAERTEWAIAALTTEEQTGVAQFRASITQARASMAADKFALTVQTRRAALLNGSVAKMKNAPRQEVIDAMVAVLDAFAA